MEGVVCLSSNQPVLYILLHKRFECGVEIWLSAIHTVHISVSDKFHLAAASEAERKIGAFQTLLILPAVFALRLRFELNAGPKMADLKFIPPDKAWTFV